MMMMMEKLNEGKWIQTDTHSWYRSKDGEILILHRIVSGKELRDTRIPMKLSEEGEKLLGMLTGESTMTKVEPVEWKKGAKIVGDGRKESKTGMGTETGDRTVGGGKIEMKPGLRMEKEERICFGSIKK